MASQSPAGHAFRGFVRAPAAESDAQTCRARAGEAGVVNVAAYVMDGMVAFYLRPCLVPKKICKIFQILRHIESLDACMEY